MGIAIENLMRKQLEQLVEEQKRTNQLLQQIAASLDAVTSRDPASTR